MEAYILDKDFNKVAVVDNYISFIWTDRYYSAGDFEIYAEYDPSFLKFFVKDYYLWRKEDTEHTMIIQDIQINSDIDTGLTITVTGSSLESILNRRIIWNQTVLNGNFQNGIKKLLNENIINPSIAERKIPNFIFKESTDPKITEAILNIQYTGDNLYDAIVAACQSKNIGFKVTLNEENQFVFELYYGTDRSYNQDKNPYIVFSPNFDNMLNSNYYESNSNYKNLALVAGEGEGSSRVTRVVGDTTLSSLNRRELYVDARDLQSNTSNGNISTAQYYSNLDQRGKEKLKEYSDDGYFQGEAETVRSFKYNKDFFLGDIVQTANEYGLESPSRIEEMIFTKDLNGYTATPTFAVVDE